MATYHSSRSTGEVDGVGDNKHTSQTQSYNYSTIFSNKLIDLAISADDAEVTENQRQTAMTTTSTLGEERIDDKTPVSMSNFVTEEPYENEADEEDVNDELNGSNFEKNSVRMNFLQNGKSVCGSEFKVDGKMSGRNRKEAQESSTKRIPVKKTNGLLQRHHLVTVFSSPCQEYFNGSKKSNTENELPAYVKMMMEKDLALSRLVKTGSVTISQVKEDFRGEDDERYLEDEDYFYDDYGDESEGNHPEVGRPFAPMGNIDDWDEFPFARRLLELAHMSISVSSNASSPARSDNISNNSGIIKLEKTLPNPNSTQKPQAPASTKGKKKVKTTSSIPSTSGVQINPKRPFKIEQQHEVPVTNFSISWNQSRLSPSPLLDTAEALQNGGTVNGNKKKVQRKKKAVAPIDTTNGSDGDDLSSPFLVDPMKFLEVSLQEGQLESKTIPADSHRRKYKCNYCEKKFCWSTDLKRHTLIHTGERPFKCTECPANFTRKFLLQKHLKKAHQSPPAGETNNFLLVPKLDSSSFLQGPPRPQTDEEESGSGSGDVSYAKDIGKEFSFAQVELKDEMMVPDHDEDCFDDYEMDEGRSDGEGLEITTTRIGGTNGYSNADDLRVNNVTYLDF